MSRYEGVRFVLIAPEELKVPDYIKYEVMDKHATPYEEPPELEAALPELDILYMTRIQRERFADPYEYERLKDSYVLTPEKLTAAKSDMAILHPLPRVNEISVKVDDDPRACYFRQALCGKYIRMALIYKLLQETDQPSPAKIHPADHLVNTITCHNPRCITNVEQELDQVFYPVNPEHGIYRCLYCEEKAKYSK